MSDRGEGIGNIGGDEAEGLKKGVGPDYKHKN